MRSNRGSDREALTHNLGGVATIEREDPRRKTKMGGREEKNAKPFGPPPPPPRPLSRPTLSGLGLPLCLDECHWMKVILDGCVFQKCEIE